MTIRSVALSVAALTGFIITAGADSAPAEEPRLTMHVMLQWGAEPLDWDGKKSLALVTMPDDAAEHPMVREIAIADPVVVESTLAANFPRLSDEELGYLADLFLEAFHSSSDEVLRASFVTTPLIHVKSDGSEFLGGDANRIVCNDSPPPDGSTAKAGPDGHFLLLGEFYVEQNTSGAHSLPAASYTLTADEEAIPIQVAIGMFSH